MPIIRDPKMNANNEKEYGVAYFENDFQIGNNDYIAGHYFYRKDTGSPNDPFNPRYLPQGFPILARGRLGGKVPQDIIDKNKEIYTTLIYNTILRIEADPFYVDNQQTPTPTTNLDSLYPMSAYLNRCISNGRSGLPQFDRGNPYIYNRDNTSAVIGRVSQ